jgi:hypothetical protein
MRSIGIMACVALLAAGVAPGASAQSDTERQRQRAEDTIREGAETIVRGIEQLLRSIPQYEAPQVLDNGDIVIRRKPPKSVPAKPRTQENGDSRT